MQFNSILFYFILKYGMEWQFNRMMWCDVMWNELERFGMHGMSSSEMEKGRSGLDFPAPVTNAYRYCNIHSWADWNGMECSRADTSWSSTSRKKRSDAMQFNASATIKFNSGLHYYTRAKVYSIHYVYVYVNILLWMRIINMSFCTERFRCRRNQ